MLNNNDKKYILKRVIVFLIISFISYFMFSGCVKAATYSAEFQYKQLNLLNNGYDGTTFIGGTAFSGTGQGELIFSAVVTGTQALRQAYLNVGSDSSNLVQLQCDIGNNLQYKDSQQQLVVYTIKCPANLGASGIYSVAFQGVPGVGGLLLLSDRATFVTSPDSSASIISSQQQASQQTIQEIQQQGQYDRVNADANATRIITNINTASSQAHQDSQAINNSINSTDSDDESSSCGIICKLKSIVSFLKPSNLIHLIVPSQEDWQSVFNNAIDTIRNKMGVIGLVMSIFFNFFSVLIGTYAPNYCMQWQDLNIPYFNEWGVASQFTLIPAGQFCIDTYFQDGIYKTFHDTFIVIVGGLIVFAFINYIHKCYKRLLDIPITADDEYEYITESSWQSAHVDYNGNNDYEDFGRSNRRTYRKKV